MPSKNRTTFRAAWVAIGMLAVWGLALPWSCGCAASAAHVAMTEPEVVAREMLEPFPCEGVRTSPDEHRAWRAAKLRLNIAADHVRFVRQGSAQDHDVFAALGDACAAAAERAGCEARIAELDTVGRSKQQVYAITSARGEVDLHEGREVLKLLGAIDNVDKAWLALMVATNTPAYLCGHAEWHGIRATKAGFETSRILTKETCPPAQRLQIVEHVDRAGAVTRLREHIVDHAEECVVDESLIRPVPRK